MTVHLQLFTIKVYAWGKNGSGQLGICSTSNVNVPNLVGTLNDKAVCRVYASTNFSGALTEDGQVEHCRLEIEQLGLDVGRKWLQSSWS